MDRLNSTRFLDAFIEVETEIRKVTNSSSGDSFVAALAVASKSRADLRRFQSEIRRYADLRNVIVHERAGRGEPIAEPHDETVGALERIAALITAPPRLERLPALAVKTCTPNDSVLSVATVMFEGRFSQLPVYDDNGCAGVVTSETIARWLAVKLKEDGGVLDDCSVSEILQYREDSSIHRFMARQDTVAEAIEAFESVAKEGKYLDAVIVTQTGSASQRPLNILTVFDLPRLGRLARGEAI